MNTGDILKEMPPSEVVEYIDSFIKVARESIKDPGISKDDVKKASINELIRQIEIMMPIQYSKDIIIDLEILKDALKEMPDGTVCKKVVCEMVERIFFIRSKSTDNRYEELSLSEIYSLIDELIALEKQKENNNKDEKLLKLKAIFLKLPRAVFCKQVIMAIYEMLNKDENDILAPYYNR